MQPGSKSPSPKALPFEVVNELVAKSHGYLYELLKCLDQLIEEEKVHPKVAVLKRMKDLLLMQSANFRLLTQHICPDSVDGLKKEPPPIMPDVGGELEPMLNGHSTKDNHLGIGDEIKEDAPGAISDCAESIELFQDMPVETSTEAVGGTKKKKPRISKKKLKKRVHETEGVRISGDEVEALLLKDVKTEVEPSNELPLGASPAGSHGATGRATRRRKTKYSQEFLREALQDSHVVDGEAKRCQNRKNEKKEDDDFSPNGCKEVEVGNCRLCQVPLTSQQAVNHVKEHHAEMISELYKCPICGKELPKLERHIKMYHHPDRLRCDLCQKPFLTKYSMMKHRKIVHFPDEQDFVCDGPQGCGQRFFNEKDFCRHKSTNHEGIKKNLVCDICGTAYNKRQKLQNHLANIHKVIEKAHSCSLCSKQFASETNLMRHMPVHTQTRNFVCSICSKCFARKNNLEQHMVSHRPPKHECKICGKKFLYRSAGLGTHLKQVHKVDKLDVKMLYAPDIKILSLPEKVFASTSYQNFVSQSHPSLCHDIKNNSTSH